MNPATGKPWVPDDLRDDSLPSGYRHVGHIGGKNPWSARHYDKALAKHSSGLAWWGLRRATPEEAAQDYCDYMNGAVAAPVPKREDVESQFFSAIRNSRGDANDLGPRDHERRGTLVKPKHREQLEASGFAGQDIEFKPDGITVGEMQAMLGKALAQIVAGEQPPMHVMNGEYDAGLEECFTAIGVKVVWANDSDLTDDGYFQRHLRLDE